MRFASWLAVLVAGCGGRSPLTAGRSSGGEVIVHAVVMDGGAFGVVHTVLDDSGAPVRMSYEERGDCGSGEFERLPIIRRWSDSVVISPCGEGESRTWVLRAPDLETVADLPGFERRFLMVSDELAWRWEDRSLEEVGLLTGETTRVIDLSGVADDAGRPGQVVTGVTDGRTAYLWLWWPDPTQAGGGTTTRPDEIEVIDVATGGVRDMNEELAGIQGLDIGAEPALGQGGGLALDAVGRRLFVQDTNGGLAVVDLDGIDPTRSVDVPLGGNFLFVPPDLLLGANRVNPLEIFAVDLGPDTVRRLYAFPSSVLRTYARGSGDWVLTGIDESSDRTLPSVDTCDRTYCEEAKYFNARTGDQAPAEPLLLPRLSDAVLLGEEEPLAP